MGLLINYYSPRKIVLSQETYCFVGQVILENMVKLRCNCLNVSVDALGSNLREVEGPSFISSERGNDSFFCGNIYEVQLAVAGIRKELDFLVQQRNVEDWIVFKCLGCNTEPYALHSVKREERVLVSKNVQRDPDKVASFVQSQNFSPAFNILLSSASNEEETDAGNSYSSESITTAGSLVQDHVKRFLKCEEEEMEARIERYAAEQKRQFVFVQTRAFNDKKAMLGILRKAAESKVEQCLSDAIADVLDTDSGKVPEAQVARVPGLGLSEVANIQIARPSIVLNQHNKKDKSDFDGDHLDPMFPGDQDFPPFVESDEEESSDNSFNSKDDYNTSKYSSSVPMNVPFLHKPRSVKCERLMDEDDIYEAPDNIAESIQALARSVQDSRNIFGDLPRPRVNTLPLELV